MIAAHADYFDSRSFLGRFGALLVAPRAVTAAREPRIRNNEKLPGEFQAHLQAAGVELVWPRITPR